jgi:methyltransferase
LESVSLLDLVNWSWLHLLIPLLIVQRIWELRIARRNTSTLLAEGGVERGAEHYPYIVALHVIWFAAMILEIVILSRQINPFWYALLAIVLVAQWLRIWAIRSLGKYWTTRVIMLPNHPRVTTGPYRYLRHPNYVAVIIELFVFPIIFSSYLTAITASLINAWLLRKRIQAEDN